MLIENGAGIKKARTAAGMSQAALAKEAGCVTAGDISKAERGLKELTPEQLEAVAKVLGADPELLQEPSSLEEAGSSPSEEKSPADSEVTLTAEERELLDLYRSADAEKRNMAIAILRGVPSEQDYVNFLAGMLKGSDSAELINAVKKMILSSKVEDLLAIVKNLMAGKNGMGLMSALTGMSGSGSAGVPTGSPADGAAMGSGENRNGTEISTPLLAFTYLYANSIYILLLAFYFWLWRTDIKPEK